MTEAHTSKFYSEILERLNGVRRKQHNIALVYGALATLLIAFATLLIAIALEGVFSFGTLGRTILFTVVTLAISGAASWFVGDYSRVGVVDWFYTWGWLVWLCA